METILKADTKLTVVMCCKISDERYTAPSSSNIQQPLRLWTEHQPAVDVFFYQRFKKNLTFFIIYISIMFLHLKVSCDQKLRRNLLLKGGLNKLVGWTVKVLETAIECGQFHVFGTF